MSKGCCNKFALNYKYTNAELASNIATRYASDSLLPDGVYSDQYDGTYSGGNQGLCHKAKLPKNGEYTHKRFPRGIGTYTQLASGNFGCLLDKDKSGCTGVAGTQCNIIRSTYNGNNIGCCLLGGGNAVLTDLSNTEVFDWNKIPVDLSKIPGGDLNKAVGIGLYTCNADIKPYATSQSILSDPNAISCQSVVSKACGVQSSDTYNEWTVGGLCNNYLNNSSVPAEISSNVLQSALTGFLYSVPGAGGLNLRSVDQSSTLSNPNLPSNDDTVKYLRIMLDMCAIKTNSNSNEYPCKSQLEGMCKFIPNSRIVEAYNFVKNPKNIKDTTEYINNQNIISACGCHMAKEEYSNFVTQECSPTCLLPGTIPSDNPCDQTTCVIDSLSINIAESNVGDIQFNTFCGGMDCQSGENKGSCRCIFKDIDVNIQNSNVPDLKFQQNCGGVCYITSDTDKTLQPIDCNSIGKYYTPTRSGGTTPTGPTRPGATPSDNEKKTFYEKYKVYILVGGIVVILLILYYIFRGSSSPKSIQDMYMSS